jgi:hypothetical protein
VVVVVVVMVVGVVVQGMRSGQHAVVVRRRSARR